VSDARDALSDDEAIAARELFRSHRHALGKLMEMGSHAKALKDAGMGSDVACSARLDRYDVLPFLEKGRIVCVPWG
jgi:phosphosulfolactate phosphohydrolase-like enzyme